MALPTMLPGFVLAEQCLDEHGKVAGEARGRAIVVQTKWNHDDYPSDGARILFYEYTAHDVTIDGKQYIVLKEDDIYGYEAP